MLKLGTLLTLLLTSLERPLVTFGTLDFTGRIGFLTFDCVLTGGFLIFDCALTGDFLTAVFFSTSLKSIISFLVEVGGAFVVVVGGK